LKDWILEKVKSTNAIVDIGIIISILTGLLMVMIYAYKMTYMKLIGVPVNIFIHIVDINFHDFIIAFFLALITIVIGGISYFLFNGKTFIRKAITVIVLFIITVVSIIIMKTIFKSITTYTLVMWGLIFFVSILFIQVPMYLLTYRPNLVIEKIFKKDNEILKFIVSISEGLAVIGAIVIVTMYLSNISLLIPSSKVMVDDQILLYAADDGYLVSDYDIYMNGDIKIKKIKLNRETFELISKENKIKSTSYKYLFD